MNVRVVALLLGAVIAAAAPVAPAASTKQVASDLDALMERVISRRDDNWKKLQQYVLEEDERFQLTGPDGSRLYGFVREYTWFIRDSVFVRSPLEIDGVTISERDRTTYEAEWIRRERARAKRVAERVQRTNEEQKANNDDPSSNKTLVEDGAGSRAAATTSGLDDVLARSLEPRFVSAAYFLRFKFDPGHYALAGRERLNDRDLMRIEYYPSRLFNEGRTRPNRRARERDQKLEAKMNKVALVTLWIDPAVQQIVRYTFDNIDMDFMPGRSLVRVDEISASMNMAQPFPGVWLPASIEGRFAATTAVGSVSGKYEVTYRDHRLAEVTTKIRPPQE